MKCEICPRKCGERGFCGVGIKPRLARAALHFDEEPVISGTRGSGAVFFSGCPLKCVYCQNWEISHDARGAETDDLRSVYMRLIEQGAHNINLVTAGHFLPAVLKSLDPPLPVPVVWNSSGYETVAAIRALAGKVQIYLPDMKYASSKTASELSQCPDYPQVARAALTEMHAQIGPPVFEDGLMVRGMLVRHLILPGRAEESVKAIEWVMDNLPNAWLSVMSQYTPTPAVAGSKLDRRIYRGEYEHVWRYLESRGFENGFVQALSSAKRKYTPAFDLTGVFE